MKRVQTIAEVSYLQYPMQQSRYIQVHIEIFVHALYTI